MKKLSLAVEDLTVDSFQTDQTCTECGTVEGQESGFTCVCPTWLKCPTILTRDCCTP